MKKTKRKNTVRQGRPPNEEKTHYIKVGMPKRRWLKFDALCYEDESRGDALARMLKIK